MVAETKPTHANPTIPAGRILTRAWASDMVESGVFPRITSAAMPHIMGIAPRRNMNMELTRNSFRAVLMSFMLRTRATTGCQVLQPLR